MKTNLSSHQSSHYSKKQLSLILQALTTDLIKFRALGAEFKENSKIDLHQDCAAFDFSVETLLSTLSDWNSFLTKGNSP